MTVAVCIYCGEIKHGAFNPCHSCSRAPTTEEDAAISLLLTDHTYGKQRLEEIGMSIRSGKSPTMDAQTRAMMLGVVRQSKMFSDNQGVSQPSTKDSDPN